MIRKLTTVMLAITVALSLAVPACAFTDVDENTESMFEINEFTERGLLKGYPDGTFRPLEGLKRSEFITLVNRTFKYEETDIEFDFTDIPENAWYLEHLRIAVANGYIEGYPDGTFQPESLITREEAAVILNRILGYEETESMNIADEVAEWALSDVLGLLQEKIMSLDEEGVFRGGEAITRTEIVVSLLAVLKKAEEAVEEESMSGGSSGSSGLSGSTGSTDPSDPPDEEEDAINHALGLMVENLNALLDANEMDSDQLAVIEEIRDSINNYIDDSSYDFESDMDNVRQEIMDTFEFDEQLELLETIRDSIPDGYEEELGSFFGLSFDEEAYTVTHALGMMVENLNAVLAGEASYAPEMNESQLAVIEEIRDSINNYIDDSSYDFESDMDAVRQELDTFGTVERLEIALAVEASIPGEYEEELHSFFGF